MRFVGGAVGAGIGFMIGGPVGAQLGFAVGSMIGGSFEPDQVTTNTGPRLDDLSQPTSNIVGNQIPIVYGTDRVSAGIIWSSNIKETKHVSEQSSGGKGGGGGQTVVTETFTYSASFAVGLCEGPINGIRRIWINRAIVYNLDDPNIGRLDLDFAVYYGNETQYPDPTIEGYEGIGNVTANRGLAYILFRDLQLADFGNRVPATIEVEVVISGAAVCKATQTHLSQTVIDNESPTWTNVQRIVKSPATGLYWKGTGVMADRTKMQNGYFAEAFNDYGVFVTGLSPNMDQQWRSSDPTKHSGAMHIFPNANGILIFVCFIYDYVSSGVYDYGIWMYDEYGSLEYWNSPIIGFQSGSFNFWQPLVNGMFGGVPDEGTIASTIWRTGDFDHSEISDITMTTVKDLDGSHYESFGVRNKSGNYTYHTIDNTDYNKTYTWEFFFPYSGQGWFSYENDENNLRKDLMMLQRNSANDTFALIQVDTLYSVGSDPAKYTLSVYELTGYHDTDLLTSGSGQLNFGGVTLLNGDTWAAVCIRNASGGSPTSPYISWFVRPNGGTEFNYVTERYFGENTNDWLGYNVAFDSARNEMILIEEGPDRLWSFNIITHEWASQTITGFLDAVNYDLHKRGCRDIFIINTNTYLLGNDNDPNVRMYRLNRDYIDKEGTNLGAIAGNICDRVTVDNGDYDTGPIDAIDVKGFSVRRHTSAKNILNAILPAHFVDPVESEWQLKFIPYGDTTTIIDNDYLNASIETNDKSELYKITNEDIDEIPKALALQYSGYKNNYLKTQQSSFRDGFIYNHDNADIIEVPVVFDDSEAAKIVDKLLYMLFISAAKFEITLPIRYAYLEVSDIVTFELNTNTANTETFTGKITNIETNALNLIEIRGTRYFTDSINSYVEGTLQDSEGDQIIPIVGYMYTQPIDFRPLTDYQEPERQGTSIYMTGSGYIDNWGGGQTYFSQDDINYGEFLYITNAVTFGKLSTDYSMYNRRYTIEDNAQTCNITVQGGPAPQSITDDEMKAGKNTMIIFDGSTDEVLEVLQFKTVATISTNNYTISNTYRQRYQTYNNYDRFNITGYPRANDKFIILNDSSLYQGSISADLVGANSFLKGVSVGQRPTDIPGNKYIYTGQWEINAPPVHFKAEWASSTTVDLSWQAVSRFAGRVMFANPEADQYVEQFRIEVLDIDDTVISTIDAITGTSYTYTLESPLVDGDYMEFRIYQYSDTQGYTHSNYTSEYFCSDPEAGIEAAHQGTEQIHLEFKEEKGATTLIDSGAASNDFVQVTTPTSPYKTKGRMITNTEAGAWRLYKKHRFKSTISAGSSRNDVCFSFWITLHNRPTTDITFWDSDGSGNYGNYEIKLRTGGGLRFQISGATIDYTGTIPYNIPTFIMFSKNGNEIRIFDNGVFYSSASDTSFKWYLQGFMYIGCVSNYSQDFTLADFRLYRDNIASDAKAMEVYKYSRAKLLPQYRRP